MMRGTQVTASIFRRCRRGDPEALHTVLLRVADPLYSASLAASIGEAEAGALALHTWQRLLRSLNRWGMGGDLTVRLQELLADEILPGAGSEAAERALALWLEAGSLAPVAAPPALLAGMEQVAQEMAPVIGRQARRRRWAAWAGTAVAAVAVGALATGALWVLNQVAARQTRQVEWEALRERVGEQHLTWALRDALLALPDPRGADAGQETTLAQAALVLEELAASAEREPRDTLYHLQNRIEQGNLAARLAQMTVETEGPQRAVLAQTTLVLEEVRSL